jgi:hypothetical protein
LIALLLLLLQPPPLVQAALAVRDDGCDRPDVAISKLAAIRTTVAVADRPLVDRASKIVAQRHCDKTFAVAAEIFNRYGDQNPNDARVQHQVIGTVASMADEAEPKGVPARPFLDSATKRARAVAAKWPKDAESYAHLGAMLGILQAGSLDALQAFGHCLDLNPQHQLCKKSFGELSEYYEAPRCDAKDLRGVTIGGVSVNGAVVLTGVAHLYADDVARSRIAKKQNALPVIAGGKPVASVDAAIARDKELIAVSGAQIEQLCRKVTHVQLPAAMRKYR